MKTQISIIAGIVLCLASIRAADSSEAGTDQTGKKEKLKADQRTGAQSATQGRGQFTNSTGVVHSDTNNKKELSPKGNHQNGKGVPQGSVTFQVDHGTNSKGDKKKLSSGSDPKPQQFDAQGRVIVATDDGIWRGGKTNNKKVTTGGTNHAQAAGATNNQGLNAHNTGALRSVSGNNTSAGPKGVTTAKKSKTGKQGETKKADKNMTLKGQKILQN